MGEHVFFICKWNQNLFLNVAWFWGRRECILPISKACSFHDVTWIYPKNRVGRDVSSSHCAKAAFMGSILRLEKSQFHPSWCMLRGCWCHLDTFATTSWWRPGLCSLWFVPCVGRNDPRCGMGGDQLDLAGLLDIRSWHQLLDARSWTDYCAAYLVFSYGPLLKDVWQNLIVPRCLFWSLQCTRLPWK